jgi:hypothetical protein
MIPAMTTPTRTPSAGENSYRRLVPATTGGKLR